MRTRATLARTLLLGCVATAAVSCPSAYDRTYQRETERLETEQAEREAAERAAHAEAQRYAAVVYFEVGSSVIQERGYHELRWLVERLRSYPEAVIEVRGFADATGPEAANQRLSEERARVVARYLEGEGIERSRILVQGFASSFPAASNEISTGRRSNRRVEVTVR